MKKLKRLWSDDKGVVATTDLILMSVVVVLGIIVGLVTFRDQVVQELGDVAGAIGHLNQGYNFTGDGMTGDACFVAGSSYTDQVDFCEENDTPNAPPSCIEVSVAASDEGRRPAPAP
jgi:hypothetical protein